MAIDAVEFRNGMARLGAGVAVVTTDGPAGRLGVTCTAVCSVSDDPPTLLVCLHRQSRALAALKSNGVFCVNVLSGHQEEISKAFGGQAGMAMSERFATGQWRTLSTGAPALLSAIESIDCKFTSLTEVGTHSVVFGEVGAIAMNPEANCLIYLNRQYRSLHDEMARSQKHQ
ncbi:flavin reductase [Bradyrhizobium manausense]